MSTAILTANLNNFDDPIDPVVQTTKEPYKFYRFDDKNFPPITGLTPRLEYRIPKLFGWQMYPGFDYYIWLDGSVSMIRDDAMTWMLDQLGEADFAFFKHPWRRSIREEVDHIEEKLKSGNSYITSRYKNGLHKEQYADILLDPDYVDDKLYASTAFIYRDYEHTRDVLRSWWLHQSRYFTVDQIVLPYMLRESNVVMIDANPFKGKYISSVSEHK